jgi:SAM-dependent methyltransferase
MKLTGLIPLPARKTYRAARRFLQKQIPWWRSTPPPGYARFRKWRSVRPIRRNFGWDTGGRCVDRYFIEGFLERNSDSIRGRVLEVAENDYTMRFGGDKVTRSDILHVVEGSPGATIIGNLATGEGIPESAFDCIILTQVLFCIFDLPSVIRTIFKSLAPGGVVLVTEPGISQIARYDMEQWGDCWRFTSCSANKLFATAFPEDHVMVETRGNVLTSIAFLHGLLATELTVDELEYQDPDYQMCILIKAVKPGPSTSAP